MKNYLKSSNYKIAPLKTGVGGLTKTCSCCLQIKSCNSLPGTMKETGQDNTTTSTLHVESLTEDQFYTCRVQSNQEYSFISKIEVNGNIH